MANNGKAYRTALVTGASSGIGRALSAWLARRGVRVFAAARRLDALSKLEADGSSAGGKLPPGGKDGWKTPENHQQNQGAVHASCGPDPVLAHPGVRV